MNRVRAVCDTIVGCGLAALVLFTPLAFGSVETWAVTVVEAAIFFIGAAALAAVALAPREDRSGGIGAQAGLAAPVREGRSSVRIEPLIVVFAVVVLFQLVPLPNAVVSLLSPRASALYERTVPGYTAGSSADFDEWLLASDASRAEIQSKPGGGVHAPLSYSPPLTRDRLVLFSAWAVLFLVAARRFRDRDRSRRMIVWITFVGVGVAIVGLFQLLAGNGKVLWLRNPPPASRPFGPFVNPNHFAGYMELIVPLALGLLLTLTVRGGAARESEARVRGRETAGHLGSWTILRADEEDARRRAWTETQRFPKAVLLAFLLAMSVASIVLSLSRGGFLATLLTFLIFAKALVPPSMSRHITPRVLVGVLAVLVVVMGIAFWVGASAVAERASSLTAVQSDPSLLSRVDTWVRSLEMFREHPAMGVGLGAFQTAFSGYYPPGTYGVWRETHNDYVQLLSEVGVIGTIPALMALFLFVRLFLIPSVTDLRPGRYLRLGLAMGTVSLFLHSFVDFNLQVTAVAFLFVLVGGMLAAGVSERPSSEPQRGALVLGRAAAAIGALLLVAAAVLAGTSGARRAEAERTASRLAHAVPAPVAESDYRGILSQADGEPRLLATLADSALAAFDVASRRPSGMGEAEPQLRMAESTYRRIAALAPLSAWSWWGLGEVYARRSRIEKRSETFALDHLLVHGEEDFGRQAKLALAAYRIAVMLEPNSYEVRDDLASLYLQEGLRDAALGTYRESGRIMPLYYLHDYGPIETLDRDVFGAIAAGMEDALADPGMVPPGEVRQTLGDAAITHGDFAEAVRQYRLGVAAEASRATHESLVYLLGEALRRAGKTSEATEWLMKATAADSVAWQAWRGLGDISAAAGEHCEAFRAYATSLACAPAEQSEDAVVRAAREQAACGQRAEAIAQLRSFKNNRPSALEARELLVQLLRESGQGPEALEEARSLSEAAPGNSAYRNLVASVEREATGRDATSR